MLRRGIYLAVLLILAESDFAQQFQWARSFGSPAKYNSVYSRLSCDRNGDLILAAILSTKVDIDPGPDTVLAEPGLLVAKFVSNGDLAWAATISSQSLASLTVDSSGNVIVSGIGSAYGKLYINSTSGKDSLEWDFTPTFCFNCFVTFVVKLDASGKFQWAFNFSPNSLNYFKAIAGSNNEIFLCGTLADTIDFSLGAGSSVMWPAGSSDALIAKYDAYGNFLWAKRFGTVQRSIGFSNAATDADGNIYITGSLEGTVNYASTGTLTLTDSSAVTLTKYDSNGQLIWANKISTDSINMVFGLDLAVGSAGDLAIAGSFLGTLDMDPTGAVNTVTNSRWYANVILGHYDQYGQLNWARSFESSPIIALSQISEAKGVAINSAGHVFVTGTHTGNLSFTGAPGGDTLYSNGNMYSVFVAGFESDGDYKWSFGLPSNSTCCSNIGYAVQADASGNVFLSGILSGTGNDLNPDTPVDSVTVIGITDIFIAKYHNTTTSDIIQPAGAFAVYPNPSTDNIYLDYTGNLNEIHIINVLGQAVSFGGTHNSQSKQLRLDISGLASGVYFVTLRTDSGDFKQKLVVNR